MMYLKTERGRPPQIVWTGIIVIATFFIVTHTALLVLLEYESSTIQFWSSVQAYCT